MAIVSALVVLLQAGKPVAAPAPTVDPSANVKPAEVSCTAPLRVDSAEFGTVSQDKRRVISLVKGGRGYFVSIPTAAARTEWGVPLSVRYSPSNASVTQVRVALVVDDAVKATSTPMVVDAKNGDIHIPDLIMPVFEGLEPLAGSVGFSVILNGDVCGRSTETETRAPNVTVSGNDAFTPLFDVHDALPSNRRYGGRDPGGDGWATRGAIEWLRSRPYRFDDITGLHAPQTASGRSTLGHAGHSNGRQIDMRYADGAGGFTDALGGAVEGKHILRLINDAAAEVQGATPDKATGAAVEPAKPSATGAVVGDKVKPATAMSRLQAWVSANRRVIASELPGAERVYIGNSWLAAMLRDGLFPDQTPAPGIGPWTLSPEDRAKVAPVPGHLHHWHINLKQ